MYALVDCNTFYASCEAVFNPAIRNEPVVVLSNNDGCIISSNAKAKALNIPDMLPFFQVETLVKKNNVHIFSSNYELYADISARVMCVMEPYSTEIEVYSIDEAFLRLPGCDYHSHGKEIKNILWQQIRMPVCVGIAPTKTLAKLANHAAKKIQKLNGVCVLNEKHKWEWLLAQITCDKIWGVGRRICQRLHHFGIHNALQLAQVNPKYLRLHFSVMLERTIRELNGEACLDLELETAPRKEIFCTRSFSYKITRLNELQQAISLYADRVCEKLRKQNGLSATLWIYLEGFDKKVGHFCPQRIVKLPFLTNDTKQVASTAAKTLAQIYQPGIRYKKCGIGLLDVCTKKHEQKDFFNQQQTEKSRKLMHVIDQINQRYGKHTVKLLNSGIQPKWMMKRAYMSPRYTTCWKDIPVAQCQ